MDIEELKRKLEEKSKTIDNEIAKFVPKESDIENLYEGIWYAIESGGKRLRPFLCLETCVLLGGKEEHAMPFAVAIELLHNWLLIHDDIEDGDTVRRNIPTVWVKYGVPHAINIGDMMAHKVFEVILSCKERGMDDSTIVRLMRLIKDTVVRTGEGQAIEINLRAKDDVTEEEYMKMVMLKTGYYLACPIVAGAIIAGLDEFGASSLCKYGEALGPAFQIRDDVIDLTEGKGRLEKGCDIKEGKRSIMVAYTASKCAKEEKKKLFEILNKPREKTTEEDIKWAIDLFNKYKAMEYAQKKADELIGKAKQTIVDLPEVIKEFLDVMGKYITERKT